MMKCLGENGIEILIDILTVSETTKNCVKLLKEEYCYTITKRTTIEFL